MTQQGEDCCERYLKKNNLGSTRIIQGWKRGANNKNTTLMVVASVMMSVCMRRSAVVWSFNIPSSSYSSHVCRSKWQHHMSAAAANDDGSTSSAKHNDSNSELEEKKKILATSSRLSLAPMMEYTDRHFRHLIRQLSKHTLLYTEMVAANAIAHEYNSNDSDDDDWALRRFLSTPPNPGPTVLQLGGSDPEQLFVAGQAVQEYSSRNICDYTALNLNCGCPSPKVAGKGCFGAALMQDPTLVRDCCHAMFDGVGKNTPVTVKCRIGTDLDWESGYTMREYKEDGTNEREYQRLAKFVDTVSSTDLVTDFQMHARIAVLNKHFSPADNRKIPPLKYDYVYRLATDFPHLTFSLNGGIESLSQAQRLLTHQGDELAGVMVGRAFAANPWDFAMADSVLYKDGDDDTHNTIDRWHILQQYAQYADEQEIIWGTKIRRYIIKAIQSLFMGEARAKKFRIALDEIGGIPKDRIKNNLPPDTTPLSTLILQAAVEHLSEDALHRTPQESQDRIMRMEQQKQEKKTLLQQQQQQQQQPSQQPQNNSENDKSIVASEWASMREADREATKKAREDGEEDITDYAQMLQQQNVITTTADENTQTLTPPSESSSSGSSVDTNIARNQMR